MIYLDNASTSFPKPAVVWQAMRSYIDEIGVSPSRGLHRRGMMASQIVDEARSDLASLFGVQNPAHVVFTQNATHALNVAIKGALDAGAHVVTTGAEHNSVLRPLEALRRSGTIEYTTVSPSATGVFDLNEFEAAFRPATRLVIVNHASNVTGAVAPVREMFAIARRHGALTLLDTSQTAGYLDIAVDDLGVDMLAFTGHKWLHGPSGVGGLFIRDPSQVKPLLDGATGQSSQSIRHPLAMPAKFEAGTLNYLGIAALRAVLRDPQLSDLPQTRLRTGAVQRHCLKKLGQLRGVQGYPVDPSVEQIPVISINVDRFYPGEVGTMLDERFSILVRTGLHCAPLIHKALGTSRHGTIRLSLGSKTTEAEIDVLAASLEEIAKPVRKTANA